MKLDGIDKAAILCFSAGVFLWIAFLPSSNPETSRATQLLPLYEIVPVWRFWSPKFEGHFWTADPNERDKLIEQYPHVWTYEGVVFGVHGKAPEVQP